METDTIAAIATPFGSGGIGIIRISGSQSRRIAKKLFKSRGLACKSAAADYLDNIKSHRLYYGHIIDPKTQDVLDEVLLAIMMAPRSYTREDVLEIQSHSGPVILKAILQLVLECGARLAEPGEFTKRAYLNGRIDLGQAEAVADMISAKTEEGLKISAAHLKGELRVQVNEVLALLDELHIQMEADIEFSEDVHKQLDREKSCKKVRRQAIEIIQQLINNYDDSHLFRDGVRLDIVGRPNVGKSSLLNRLIKREKAIVTHIPGTTRDLIEDWICIDGLPILITDTAGMQATDDPVEIIGIQKTKENIERSDVVLFVIDGNDGFLEADAHIFSQINKDNIILVVNKTDLIFRSGTVEIPTRYSEFPTVKISAKFGQGLTHLEDAIKDICLKDINIKAGKSIVPNFRQKKALETALSLLKEIESGLQSGQPEDMIVADILSAQESLKAVTGEQSDDDVLDAVFNRFCIGK